MHERGISSCIPVRLGLLVLPFPPVSSLMIFRRSAIFSMIVFSRSSVGEVPGGAVKEV